MSADALMILPLLLLLTGGVLAFALGRRAARLVGPASAAATLLVIFVLALWVAQEGAQGYALGVWAAPLGIELVADGTAVFMLLLCAAVGLAVSLYALGYFADDAGADWLEEDSFWPLWLLLLAAMSALYLSADLFNLYVTLELVTLAAVALVVLSGEDVSLTSGMRYLLAALAGSLLFLFGLSLLYAAFGTLHLASLASLVSPAPLSLVTLALMTAGLLVKTALWPFHFWLPPAHASAPAPVSALLSALVVKVSFYLVLRLWLEVFPQALGQDAPLILGGLGAAAILWGSVQAIRQRRLKLLVAYSTVAQLGYLFLLFPLEAPAAGLHHALAHALAKAALFMVAGVLIHACGSDELSDLGGAARKLPLAALAFALAAWTLLGLPPSAGYLSKELFLGAGGVWIWEGVLRTGGVLTAVYLALALRAMIAPAAPGTRFAPVPRLMRYAPLALALLAAGLGLLPHGMLARLLEVER